MNISSAFVNKIIHTFELYVNISYNPFPFFPFLTNNLFFLVYFFVHFCHVNYTNNVHFVTLYCNRILRML